MHLNNHQFHKNNHRSQFKMKFIHKTSRVIATRDFMTCRKFLADVLSQTCRGAHKVHCFDPPSSCLPRCVLCLVLVSLLTVSHFNTSRCSPWLQTSFASLISVEYEVGSQKHVKTHKIPAILIATPGIDNSHIYFKCYVFYTFLLMLWDFHQ